MADITNNQSQQDSASQGSLKDTAYYSRATQAIRFYEKRAKQNIKRWNLIYKGDFFDASIQENDRVFVNYANSTVNTKIATLFYKNPKINVTPTKDQSVTQDGQPIDNIGNAKNAQEVLNWQMREYNIKRQIKRSIKDAKVSGYGVFFTGWETVTNSKTEEVKGQTGKLVDNSQSFKLLPSVDSTKQVDYVEKDCPDFRRIRPDRVFFSPDNEDEDTIYDNYVILEQVVSLDELKKDKRLEHVDEITTFSYVDNTGSGYYTNNEMTVATTQVEQSDMKRVVLYHYYDKDNWIIMAKGMGDKLLYKTDNPYKDIFGPDQALPIVTLFNDEDLTGFFPQSDIGLIERQQLELNKTRSQMINHRKRFNRVYLFDDAIPLEQIEKLKTPQDGAMIGIRTNGQPLSSLVMPLPDANLTFPFEVEPLLVEDINIVTGLAQYQRGSIQGQPKTLGQSQILESSSQSRRDEEQSKVEDFVEKIYKRLLQLDQANLDAQISMQITGLDGNPQWLQVSRQEIEGEFDLQVESGSTVKLNDDVLRQQALDAFNLLYQLPESLMIRKDLIMAVLDAMPVLKSVANKLRQIPEDQLFPLAFINKPKETLHLLADKIYPMLSPNEQAQMLDKFGIQYSPQQPMGQPGQPTPPGGTPPMSPAALQSPLNQPMGQPQMSQGTSLQDALPQDLGGIVGEPTLPNATFGPIDAELLGKNAPTTQSLHTAIKKKARH